MSGAAMTATLRGVAAAGFFGKLPARGDFVRAGLPQSFVAPWDGWMERVLAASRERLGEAWLACWMVAPIWRFALADGVCGPAAALGLWMPSVDRVGRHFPLMLAAVLPGAPAAALARGGAGFLAAAEQAGLAALNEDLTPDALARRIRPLAFDAASRMASGATPGLAGSADRSLWWTEGGPRVPPGAQAFDALPDAGQFAAMLDTRPP